LLPVYFALLFITEAAYVIYFRFLSEYTNIKSHTSSYSNSIQNLWLVEGFLLVLYLLLGFFKFMILNIVVLNLNKKIHEDMIDGILRSPCSFFDAT
jgi:hypothetical protein